MNRRFGAVPAIHKFEDFGNHFSFEAKKTQGLHARCQRFVPPSPMTTHDSLLAERYPFTRRD